MGRKCPGYDLKLLYHSRQCPGYDLKLLYHSLFGLVTIFKKACSILNLTGRQLEQTDNQTDNRNSEKQTDNRWAR